MFFERSIYLHLLDRELRDCAGFRLSDAVLLQVIRIALIASHQTLCASLSNIWESTPEAPNASKLCAKLAKLDVLRFINSHANVNEFLSVRERLYRHDQSRYPMYFSRIAEDMAKDFRPTLIKHTSTTDALRSSLEDFVDGRAIAGGFQLSSSRLNDAVRRITGKGLKKLGDLAVTGAAFSNIKGMAPDKLSILRKLISKLYTEHYLGFANSDIISGIRGLTVFDCVSNHFPIYDFQVWIAILRVAGVDQKSKDFLQIDEFLAIRGSDCHRRFLDNARRLMAGLLGLERRAVPSSADEPTRQQLIQRLESLPRNTDSLNLRTSNSWEKAYGHLEKTIADLSKEYFFRSGIEHFVRLYESPKPLILIMVATETECTMLLDIALQKGLTPIPRSSNDVTSYDLGELAGIQIVAIQCEMGSGGPAGAAQTAQAALTEMRPDAVLMPGIAFGCKENEHKMEDILVAKQIIPYELQKRSDKQGQEITLRSDRASSDEALLGVARSVAKSWPPIGVHFGAILSGEKLVNDPTFRAELINCAPEAIGGEMEGAGVWSACERQRVRWILCKGICDWGKSKDDAHQRAAARNAIHFVFGMIQTGSLVSRLVDPTRR